MKDDLMKSHIQRGHLSLRSHWKEIASLITVLVLLFTGWWQAGQWYERHLLSTTHADMQRSLVAYGNTLATVINQRFAQLEGLAAFAQINPTRSALDKNFPVYAAGLYAGKNDIRAIQIFPDDGPVYVYPISGNESVLQRTLVELINDERPTVRADVQRAIETRQLTVSAPYELRQGGLGVLARLAVYQDDMLWGIAVIILDMPPLLSEAGISAPPSNLKIALRDSNEQIIAGENYIFDANPETYQIDLPEGHWMLAIIPAGGWHAAIRKSLTMFRIAGLVLAGLMFGFLYLIITRQTQLTRAVQERTAALAESHERYRMLVEQSPYAIGVHQDEIIIFANPAAARLLGAAHVDDLVGKPINEIIHPYTQEATNERRRRMEKGEKGLYPAEDRYIRLDGGIVPVEVTIAPFTYQGRPAVQVIALDISDRKRAEETLRETADQLRLTVRAGNTGLWDWNLLTDQVYYSPEWKQLIGYKERELTDNISEWRQRLHPADIERVNTTVQAFLANPWPNYQIEFRLQHKDGSYRWILSQAALVYDENDRPVHMRGVHIDITERKHAEEILHSQEERFRLAMNNIPDVVVIYDHELRVQFINAATTRVTNRPISDYIGKREEEIWPPEIYGLYLPTLKKALETKTLQRIEIALALPNSVPRALIITCVPVLDEEGDVREVLGITHDFTERKQFEQSLQESEEKLRLFIEHAPASLAMFDNQMRYIAVSRRWLTDYSLGGQNIIGQSHYAVFPEITDRWKAIHRRGLAGEVIETDQDIFIRADGTIQWLRWEVRPWYTAENSVGGIVIFTEDITARKQAAEKLNHYGEQLAVLHKIDRGIISAQTPEDILQAILPHIEQAFACQRTNLNLFNDALTEVTLIAGETKNAAIRPIRPIHKLIQNNYLEQLKAGKMLSLPDYDQIESKSPLLETLYAEGIRSSLTVPLIVEEQLIGTFSIYSTVPSHFNEGHQEIAQDISVQLAIALRQSRLMAAIEAHAEDLEQRVNERTTQLEAKTRELETFNYSVSHDLKAPLRGIDGYSRLLLEDYSAQLDEEGRTFLHNIRSATEQMNRLIDDMLVYSRLERRSLSPVQIDLNDIIHSIITEYVDTIRERGTVIAVKEIPHISLSVDPGGLSMALRNLIDNALKFTRDTASPVIEIGGQETATSCILWVSDNGIGFDMQYHNRIFEIFQRLHRVEDYAGTGVGLAIVRKAMERVGGRVWAESEPGHGAKFYLELPR